LPGRVCPVANESCRSFAAILFAGFFRRAFVIDASEGFFCHGHIEAMSTRTGTEEFLSAI